MVSDLASTPTYAGLTETDLRPPGSPPLYPRVRGADSEAVDADLTGYPLPPHTRG